MSENNEKWMLIHQLMTDIFNIQKNVLLSDFYIKNDLKFLIEINFIHTEASIIVRYDEYNEQFEDTTDLYVHALRREFDSLNDALNFVLEMIDLAYLYKLFKLNYARRLNQKLSAKE